MIGALIVVFREVFEAGLILGIVLAVTRDVPGRGYWVSGGVAAGVLGAAIVAVFANRLSEAFAGAGQELFTAAILGVAVVMLSWHNIWMARHGRQLAAEMRHEGEAVASGSKPVAALALVVAVAVLREGFEVVLFLYAIIMQEGGSNAGIALGGGLGLVLGAGVCVLTYFGLLQIPSRHLFAATSFMIAFLAAGMASQAVTFLAQANVLTALDHVLWDTSWLLSDESISGRALRTLVGYTAQPTAMQVVVYIGTLTVIFTLMRIFAPPPSPARAPIRTDLAGGHRRG
jgi:high-affinity iron transporter